MSSFGGNSVFHLVLRFLKETVYKSAFIGMLLTLAIFPSYLKVVTYLTNQPDDKEMPGKGYSAALAFALISSFVHTFIYVLSNGFFAILDGYKLLQKYRLPRRPDWVEDNKKYIPGTVMNAIFGQLVINPVMVYFLWPYFQKLGMGNLLDEMPDPKQLVISYFICHMFNEFFFYWTHRMFHYGWFYKTFHKQHHEYKGTIGIAAEHAHPVEMLVANMLPTLGGCFVIKNHPIILLVWLFLRLRETFEAHSGYCFKGTWYSTTGLSHDDEAIHHDFHHTVNDGNFGSELTDTLFGTMVKFNQKGGQEGYLKGAAKQE